MWTVLDKANMDEESESGESQSHVTDLWSMKWKSKKKKTLLLAMFCRYVHRILIYLLRTACFYVERNKKSILVQKADAFEYISLRLLQMSCGSCQVWFQTFFISFFLFFFCSASPLSRRASFFITVILWADAPSRPLPKRVTICPKSQHFSKKYIRTSSPFSPLFKTGMKRQTDSSHFLGISTHHVESVVLFLGLIFHRYTRATFTEFVR